MKSILNLKTSLMDKVELLERALEREKKARQAAEKLLDEKSREVYSSLDLIKSQFNKSEQQKNNLQLLYAVSKFTQEDKGFVDSVREFIAILGGNIRSAYIAVFNISKQFSEENDDNLYWYNSDYLEIAELIKLHDKVPRSIAVDKSIASAKAEIVNREDIDCYGDRPFLSEDVKGVMAVPVLRFDAVVAVIEVGVADWELFPQEKQDTVLSAVSQLSVALERRSSIKELKQNHKQLQLAHSELKEAQQKLLHSEKLASVGQLAAGVAHEINNPVGYVICNIDVLKAYINTLTLLLRKHDELCLNLSKNPPPEIVPLLEDITKIKQEEDIDYVVNDIEDMLEESARGLHRVKDIVASLKDFSRTSSSEMSRGDINQCIEDTLKIVWNEIKYKNEVVKDLADLPETLFNAAELGQVFMNLIINANQATENQGVITIKSRTKNEHIVVTIADNGCGIAEEIQKDIFDPFFTTKPVGVGTGLGLSIVYSIIDNHGGKISLQSQPGKGTQFTIELPLV